MRDASRSRAEGGASSTQAAVAPSAVQAAREASAVRADLTADRDGLSPKTAELVDAYARVLEDAVLVALRVRADRPATERVVAAFDGGLDATAGDEAGREPVEADDGASALLIALAREARAAGSALVVAAR